MSKRWYPLIGAAAAGVVFGVGGGVLFALEGGLIGGPLGVVLGALAGWLIGKIPTKGERELKRLQPIVDRANELEESVSALSDEELRAKTDEYRARLREATTTEREELEQLKVQRRKARESEDAETADDLSEEIKKQEDALFEAERALLDEILPEAAACVREAARRTIGLRLYDVQIVGGVVLHQGKIAEMKTGEGKTLVATLPLYLNALGGRGAHLVTVNDYLARRDVQWMGPVYHMLGLSTAAIVHETSFLFDPTYVVHDYRMRGLRPIERKDAYAADITYGTNHEFGFDYLRDNMKFSLDEYVQREVHYAIVDEVDNILIDEARTPLIISGPAEESTDKYVTANRLVPRLRRGAVVVGDVRQEERAEVDAQGDYTIDEKAKTVTLTEQGVAKVERMLNIPNLYDPSQIEMLHHVQQALKAHTIFKRDVDYLVKDGQVIIVDEFTGRLMPGRRWSDGLHQAVEAKEGVHIERENQTLATITIQNYFRMYRKAAGMTGTADTEAPEFKKIYDLDVVVIPPNRKLQRIDHPDVVYRTEREKFEAVADQIVECNERGQPVLVGTISVEKSELLAKLLKRRRVKHNVLNAVNHEAEANIIAQAGGPNAVTIATNMAGRGTDILLGGNPEFLARAEMENEWVRRSASSPNGAHRYEELLEQLREKFEEDMEAARAAYEPRWAALEEAQASSLEELTHTHRRALSAAFWHGRASYEAAWKRLCEQTRPETALACIKALEEYSAALREVDHVTGPHFGEEGERRFEETMGHLIQTLRDAAEGDGSPPPRWQAVRAPFERTRQDYERAVQSGLGDGDADGSDESLAAAREAYERAERTYHDAEEAYAAARKPYDAAVADARATYEENRRKCVEVMEEAREQMEKAPVELRGRYEEILRKYEDASAAEREAVVAAGGLFIVGTERHESRRIDNQLRGRAGRQGDPGASRFFLSLEDDLLRIFGADRIQGLMTRLGMEEGEPIEHGLITSAVANAQSKVEARNFDIRKHLLEYDDVMNQQREIIYAKRRDVLGGESLREQALELVDDAVAGIVDRHTRADVPSEEWEWGRLEEAIFGQFNIRLHMEPEQRAGLSPREFEAQLHEKVRAVYDAREEEFTPPVARQLEKFVLLQTIDTLWKEHLLAMDHLKEGISLRGYGQRDPLQEYKKEGFSMFEEMIAKIQEDAVQKLLTVQLAREEELAQLEAQRRHRQERLVMSGGDAQGAAEKQTARRDGAKVGRNAPCPCGSGKKYKKCHGA